MKALLFSPYALISRHESVELDLITYLLSTKWEVDVIQCDGLLNDFCVSMASMGLNHASSNLSKNLVCMSCKAARNTIRRTESGARFHLLEQWSKHIPPDLIDAQLRLLNEDNWHFHEYQGIQIGRLAAVDLLMQYKVNSFHIPDSLWDAYVRQVKVCYETYFSSHGFLSEISPDRVIMYNTLFGVNRVVQQVSEMLGIPCYSLHLGYQSKSDSNALMMYRDDDSQLTISHTEEAMLCISKPLAPSRIIEAFKFFDVTLNALSHTVYSNVYSKVHPEQTRRKLQVKTGRPLLFVPLASVDERFALELLDLPSLTKPAELFGRQSEWLKFILDLARDHEEWEFVIRPHPRMFPNHRERSMATEASKLLDLISSATANVHINLPSDRVSLPEILQITDVVLGGTTSAGLEALAYGIPVVTHNKNLLFAYPAQIGSFADSKNSYVSQIRQSINCNWSVDNMLHALRWMSFLDSTVSRAITAIDQTSEDNSQFYLTSKSRIMFLRRFEVFRRLPRFLSLLLGGIYQVRAIRNWLVRDSYFTSEAEAFGRTLTEELPGLHSVSQNEIFDEVDELDALRTHLRKLLEMLGNYDDPNCLSSRIERFLT